MHLDSPLERRVHLLEASLGLPESALDEADEYAREPLPVDEPAALSVDGLDPERVLSVEEPGNHESAFHRSSRSGSAARTVGRIVIPLPPGGSNRIVSRSPSCALPAIEGIKGFHSP